MQEEANRLYLKASDKTVYVGNGSLFFSAYSSSPIDLSTCTEEDRNWLKRMIAEAKLEEAEPSYAKKVARGKFRSEEKYDRYVKDLSGEEEQKPPYCIFHGVRIVQEETALSLLRAKKIKLEEIEESYRGELSKRLEEEKAKEKVFRKVTKWLRSLFSL